MAKYARHIIGDFNEVVSFCDSTIRGGSLSASFEDGSDWTSGQTRVAVRVYERYSMLGKNRVSLNLTIVGDGGTVFVTAITSGGSQALLFKINTFGENAFLDTLSRELDRRYA